MNEEVEIRILASEANAKGDLFNRLITALFQTLGYEITGINVSRTGREIDIIAVNEAEERRVVAECKGHKKKAGGDALNKFAGVVEIEKGREEGTIGYFISLSGFTGSALEQEKEIDRNRFIQLDGKDVIVKLVQGRVIKPIEHATEQAGRYAVDLSDAHKIDEEYELLAHETGWIWAIYYSLNKKRTHFALIHADGEALAKEKADLITTADEAVGGILSSLTYLAPADPPPDLTAQIEEAKNKYFEYLAADCGEITFEGIPTDTGLATERVPLEKVFVPLFLNPYTYEKRTQSTEDKSEPEVEVVNRRPVGEVLSENSRLAILATPGGGKTTLLNRLAVAYAFPERLDETDDVLPDRTWLPILIHCRDLKGIARSPIRELILSVHRRAEMDPELTKAFGLFIDREFKGNNVLILIDGLDEIADEGDRVAFVKQLRTFLSVYPTVNIVVTSREAGFRIIGGALANECTHYKIADFDDDDIKRLVKRWSIEVEGDSPEKCTDADELIDKILNNSRIKELAVNPLLLTTLLAVKRWVRDLPPRRADLYKDAVEMLLRTWNVEGFKPLKTDEAIPQLGYVAYSMMVDGVQTITESRLKELLYKAREEMPDYLGFIEDSVDDFINRVEHRSSLLAMSGFIFEYGTKQAVYEFRHLTFQEYLAAIAVAKGYYPDRKDDDNILIPLKPYIEYEHWKEVVPLVAVIAERNAKPLVEYLIELCEGTSKFLEYTQPEEKPLYFLLLGQCLIDEITITPVLLKRALFNIANAIYRDMNPIIRLISKGKYGDILYDVVKRAYSTSTGNLLNLGAALFNISLERSGWNVNTGINSTILTNVINYIISEDINSKAEGALITMHLAYRHLHYGGIDVSKEILPLLKKIGDGLVPILNSDEPFLQFSAAWAYAWLMDARLWSHEESVGFLKRLFDLWKNSSNIEVKDKTLWAIGTSQIINRGLNPLPVPDESDLEFIANYRHATPRENSFVELPLLTIAFYWKKPYSNGKIANKLLDLYHSFNPYSNIFRRKIVAMLKQLGKPGQKALKEIEEREKDDNDPSSE